MLCQVDPKCNFNEGGEGLLIGVRSIQLEIASLMTFFSVSKIMVCPKTRAESPASEIPPIPCAFSGVRIVIGRHQLRPI
jgi:hypothetical protein